MRFAFADPPYVGQARKLYGRPEVNHRVLLGTLRCEYPDGWALSASSPSLRVLLPLCPPEVRVLAWVKPFSSFKPGQGVAYAWEPLLVCGGRPRRRDQVTVRDWCSANIVIGKGLVGAKPEAFCRWLFDVLNAQPGDALDDLFPGTGIVGRMWRRYLAELAGDQAALERQGVLT
jgi:hypothetical protein